MSGWGAVFGKKGAGMKVLIADDDSTSRLMLEKTLVRYGYEVIAAVDGHQAWEVVTQPDGPSLLVLDWMMPGINGVALCEKIREREVKDVPPYIILLTAKSDPADIIHGLEAGADDYIVKPPDPLELRARINVGVRILSLQAKSREQEKLRGALEMAGAVCHELNQPLQTVVTLTDILLMHDANTPALREDLEKIQTEVLRIGDLMRKIMHLSSYTTKDYMAGRRQIVNLHGASAVNNEGISDDE